MIRDLVESSLSRLNLRTEDREQVIDVVTRAVGAAADNVLRDLLKNQGLTDPSVCPPSDNDHAAAPAVGDPIPTFRGTKHTTAPRDRASEKELPTQIDPA